MDQERKQQLLQNIQVLQQMKHLRLNEYLTVSEQLAELVGKLEQLLAETEHLEQQSLSIDDARQRNIAGKQIQQLLQEFWFAFSMQMDARTALVYSLRRAGYEPHLPPVR